MITHSFLFLLVFVGPFVTILCLFLFLLLSLLRQTYSHSFLFLLFVGSFVTILCSFLLLLSSLHRQACAQQQGHVICSLVYVGLDGIIFANTA